MSDDTTLVKASKSKPAKPGSAGIRYTIVIDTREQLPYDFGPGVPTITRGLPTGDYSVQGWLPFIAIERKSWGDFYKCLTNIPEKNGKPAVRNRERFERCLERLSKVRFSAVVVEADHRNLWKPFIYTGRGGKPRRSQVPPLVAQKSVIAWNWRYCKIWFCGSRAGAMKWTRLLLDDAVRQLVREERDLARREQRHD